MHLTPRESYLENHVLTATPQRLQLMLVEAAIRSATRGREQMAQGQFDLACESLIHSQDCIGEVLAALNRDEQAELAHRMTGIYLFIFRRLMEGNLRRSLESVDDALRILHIERDTWREVCQQAAAEANPGADPAGAAAANSPRPVGPAENSAPVQNDMAARPSAAGMQPARGDTAGPAVAGPFFLDADRPASAPGRFSLEA